MKGFITIGTSTYQMFEVDPAEMNALIEKGNSMLWPFRFDRSKRVFPAPPKGAETIFYDTPDSNGR